MEVCKHILPLCIVLICTKAVHGFNVGAPFTSCVDRMPHHYEGNHEGIPKQEGASPFRLTLSKDFYSPGDEIDITLDSQDNLDFKGFVITVIRTTGDTEELLGNFVDIPSQAQSLAWPHLLDTEKNCITHKDGQDLKKQIFAIWKAPATTEGNLVVKATVVQSYAVTWHDIEAPLRASDTSSEPPEWPSKIGSQPLNVDYSACGVTKGCFMYPKDCSGPACEVFLSYRLSDSGEDVHFELTGSLPNGADYVSVAFSRDTRMGMEPAITCLADSSGEVRNVANGFNPGQFYTRHSRNGMTNINLVREGDQIQCSFTRPRVLDYTILTVPDYQVAHPAPDITNGSYYIFVAKGPVFKGTISIDKHNSAPIISTIPISLKDYIKIGGSSLHFNIRLHATLALVGWMMLVGFGLIVARYYKKVLHPMCCGTAVWFNLHRGSMFIGVCASIAAVIIIFVHVKAWTKSAQIHAVLGLTAVGLSLIQVISGMCRPGPNSPNRRFFNWQHRMCGVVAYMVAAATVLLGFNTSNIIADLQKTETIILLIWLAFHVFWDLMLDKFPWKYSQSEAHKVEHNGVSIQEKPATSSSSAPETVALLIYLLGTAAFAIASLYFLYSV